MNNYWAFGEMRDANDLLGHPMQLRKRFETDGYLLIRGLLPSPAISTVRVPFMEILARHGWVRPSGEVIIRPVREGDDAFFNVYDEIQKVEAFHSLAHHPHLRRTMRAVLGAGVFPHPLKVARLIFPQNWEVTTPPHQDFPNNQGSATASAVWIPLADTPRKNGGLAVLPGSHKLGLQPLQFSLGAGNRQAALTHEARELKWVTTDFQLGDVVIFGSHTVHSALHNCTGRMRLSVDFRYQVDTEPVSDLVLKPHFERQSWTDIYADWRSDRLQYYWQDLDLEVEPFAFDAYDTAEITGEAAVELLTYEKHLEQRWAFLESRSDDPAESVSD